MENRIHQNSYARPDSCIVLCVTLLLSLIPRHSFSQCAAAPIAAATCSGGNGAASSGLTIGAGTVYWVNSNTTFSTLTLNGGTLRVCGDLTISTLNFTSGNLVIENGGLVIIQAFASNFLGGNVVFINRGTLEITSSFTLQNAGNAIYNDLSTSVLEISGVLTINNAQIVNRGIMTLAGLFYQGPAGGFCVQDQSITSIYSLTNNTANSFVYSGSGSSACLSANGPVTSTVLNDNLTTSSAIHICQNFTSAPSGGAATSPGNGWGSATVYTGCSSCASVLVLGITGFTASKTGNMVELQWSSQQDATSIYYAERSTDGINFKTFTTVVPKVGETAFDAADADITAPKLYYRVRSVPVTGATLYSSIALVETGLTGQFQVFPNPVPSNSAITILVPSAPNSATGLSGSTRSSGAARLSLVDMSGNLLGTKTILLSSSANTYSWSLPRLAAGMYTVRLESPDGNCYSRIAVYGN
jgi:hypothetical protein